MPIYTTKKMRKRKRGGGDFLNLRERKKAFGWFHPKMPGWPVERAHQFIRFEQEDDDGSTKIVGRTPRCCNIMNPERPNEVLYNVCPAEALTSFISQKVASGDLDTDDLVLSGGKGKSLTEYDASDIMGTGGDWKSDWTRLRERFVFAWVPADKGDREDAEVVLAFETIALLNSLQDVTNSDADDAEDEDEADPLVNPVPFKLSYDPKADMSSKYRVEDATKKVGEPDEEVKAIFEKDLKKDYKIDLEKLVAPNAPEEILDMLEACWACDVDFDEFKDFYEEWKDEVPEDEEEEEEEDDEDEDEEEEDDEDEEEEDEEEDEPKPKKKSKGKKTKTKDKTKDKIKKKTKDKTKKKGKGKKDNAKRALTYCEECEKKVRPRKDGACPYCATDLDVPY
jgi:hypothetical protein